MITNDAGSTVASCSSFNNVAFGVEFRNLGPNLIGGQLIASDPASFHTKEVVAGIMGTARDD